MGDRSWYRIEHNRDSDTATLYLHDEVGGFGITSGQFVEELRGISAKTIKLHVNSPGGSVEDGIAIYNALLSHPAEVEAHVDAAAHSIASVIVQAAKKRVMAPHSRMMIHNAMAMGGGLAIGYADDFDAFAEEAKKVAERLRETSAEIASIYSERSGKEADHWLSLMAAEKRFTAQAAVDEGLADEVGRDYDAHNFQIAANFDWTKYREANAIKEELLEVAGQKEVEPLSESNRESVRKELDAIQAAIERMRLAVEEKSEEEETEDPRAAARRELESALARVQL